MLRIDRGGDFETRSTWDDHPTIFIKPQLETCKSWPQMECLFWLGLCCRVANNVALHNCLIWAGKVWIVVRWNWLWTNVCLSRVKSHFDCAREVRYARQVSGRHWLFFFLFKKKKKKKPFIFFRRKKSLVICFNIPRIYSESNPPRGHQASGNLDQLPKSPMRHGRAYSIREVKSTCEGGYEVYGNRSLPIRPRANWLISKGRRSCVWAEF